MVRQILLLIGPFVKHYKVQEQHFFKSIHVLVA